MRPVHLCALLLALAVPVNAQLCPPDADPCVVASTVVVPNGSTIDLGTRDLVVRSTGRIVVEGKQGAVLLAGSFRMDPGAQIEARGDRREGEGSFVVQTSRSIIIASQGSRVARIDVSGGRIGGVLLLSAGGSIRVDGSLRATGETRDGLGGGIFLEADGSIDISGAGLVATGGNRGSGGDVDVQSYTDGVTLDAPVDVSGGDCFCDLQLLAETHIVTTARAKVQMSATGRVGEGGSFTADSFRGPVSVAGAIVGNGSGSRAEESGGSGGSVDVSTFESGPITVTSRIELRGSAPDGFGGDVVVDGFGSGSVRIEGSIDASSDGNEGAGGQLLASSADGTLTLPAVDLRGVLEGGIVRAEARTLTVTGALRADGDSRRGLGGEVQLGGRCALTVEPGGAISTRGALPPREIGNSLRTGGTMMIGGPLLSSGLNRLTTGNVPPQIAPGVAIAPPPQFVVIPAGGCDDPT